MELKQTEDLLKKVDVHFNSKRAEDDFTVKEWHNVLKNYDYNDVLKKLEAHFMGEYRYSFPRIHAVVRYLPTIKNKEAGPIDYKVQCNVCKDYYLSSQRENHTNRCLSISIIVRDSARYKGRLVNIEELKKIDQKQFDSMYITFLKQIIEIEPKLADYYNQIIAAINKEELTFCPKNLLAEQVQMKV